MPNSAILLKDKLKKANANIYKILIISFVFLEIISLIKKKLKNIRKNNNEK